jgi:putative IMPACT (imprinted ancient) family translation regulator
MNEVTLKKGRGKGVKPAMVYFPLRLPTEVMEFFDAYPNKNKKIREVLASYIQQQGEVNESINQKQED